MKQQPVFSREFTDRCVFLLKTAISVIFVLEEKNNHYRLFNTYLYLILLIEKSVDLG